MTRTQRFGLLALAAVVAVGAFLLLRPGSESDTDAERSSASPTQTAEPPASEQPAGSDATPTATPKPKPKPKLPLLTGDTVRELEFKQGDTVAFEARSPEDDEIHVHGYDRAKDAPAGKTVRMSFKATITGIFEIEFEQAGKPIAELKVEP